MEAKLHLVAIAERLRSRNDFLHRRIGDAREVDQGLAHLPLLDPALRRVGEVLEATAAAAGDVGAGSRDAVGPQGFDSFEPGLGIARSPPRDPDPQLIAREPAVDEHRASLVAGERLAAEAMSSTRMVNSSLTFMATNAASSALEQVQGNPTTREGVILATTKGRG